MNAEPSRPTGRSQAAARDLVLFLRKVMPRNLFEANDQALERAVDRYLRENAHG